jgi:hypothetical protein
MKNYLHLTRHIGTSKNIENVFKYLNIYDELDTQFVNLNIIIYDDEANNIWKENKENWKKYKTIIITDTSNLALPLFLNMHDHNLNIIVYVTNRFDYGLTYFDKNYNIEKYVLLYKNMSYCNRVFFCADNFYDQSNLLSFDIKLYDKYIFRLTPHISDIIYPSNNKFFIYNRGSHINNYKQYLNGIDYDIFGPEYTKYRDEKHIAEYLGFIHLPYQTNIQSLWENLGYNIIYFIPSKEFIIKLILNESWYNFQEKRNDPLILSNLLDSTEWYLPENKKLFIYFESWEDLKIKCTLNLNSIIINKKKYINEYIKKSNNIFIEKWKKFLENINKN